LYFFYRIAEADVFRKEDTVLTLYNDGDYLSALDEMNQDHLTREQAHQQ
jgi:hypothetical protein